MPKFKKDHISPRVTCEDCRRKNEWIKCDKTGKLYRRHEMQPTWYPHIYGIEDDGRLGKYFVGPGVELLDKYSLGRSRMGL